MDTNAGGHAWRLLSSKRAAFTTLPPLLVVAAVVGIGGSCVLGRLISWQSPSCPHRRRQQHRLTVRRQRAHLVLRRRWRYSTRRPSCVKHGRPQRQSSRLVALAMGVVVRCSGGRHWHSSSQATQRVASSVAKYAHATATATLASPTVAVPQLVVEDAVAVLVLVCGGSARPHRFSYADLWPPVTRGRGFL